MQSFVEENNDRNYFICNWTFYMYDQSELKKRIRYHIDKGNQRSNICDDLLESNDTWTRAQIHQGISELADDGLIEHQGHGWYKVSYWGD